VTVVVAKSTWQSYLVRLVGQILEQGDLRSPQWRDALLAVPRHLFVPHYYLQDTSTRPWRWIRHEPGDEEGIRSWLELVYSPTTLITDVAEYAPFDKIIATCSLRAFPAPWIAQLRPGGTALVHLEGPLGAGNLLALHRDADRPRVQGRFLPWWGCFMARRTRPGSTTGSPRPVRTSAPPSTRSTTLNPAQVDGTQMFPFLAQLYLPPGMYRAIQLTDDGTPVTYLACPDGSWCEIARIPDATGHYTVREAGPRPHWASIETAWSQWTQLGAPPWREFGLTATPTSHHIWHHDPDTGPHWALPIPSE